MKKEHSIKRHNAPPTGIVASFVILSLLVFLVLVVFTPFLALGEIILKRT